jgi:hypothetical protein
MSKLLRDTLDSIKKEMLVDELCAVAIQEYLGFDFDIEGVDSFDAWVSDVDNNIMNVEFEHKREMYFVTLKKVGRYNYKVLYTNF